MTSEEIKKLDEESFMPTYGRFNAVLCSGKNATGVGCDGKEYIDFGSGIGVNSLGWADEGWVNAVSKQAATLQHTSNLYYNPASAVFASELLRVSGYGAVFLGNSGAEANECAIKLARKYSVEKYGKDRCEILTLQNSFHGRTITIVSMSADPEAYRDYGPYTPGFVKIPYNDIPALERALEDPDVAGFLVEPIQGEAGVYVPDEGYLRRACDLCHAHNVLFMADEVQTGIGRTGRMLACDHEGVRPDILILGKALGGGVVPISAVLADDEIMLTIKPGEHGSTFGGNPVACRASMAALEVVREERLTENAEAMGRIFRDRMRSIGSDMIAEVRGKGLLNAVVIRPKNGREAWDVCLRMRDNGLLAKPTHDHIIRFAPPLIISEEELLDACGIIERSIRSFD